MIEEVNKLFKSKRFNELHDYLETLNSADIPLLFDNLLEDECLVVYRLLSKTKAAEVFTYMESDMQEKLINAITDKELKAVIDELFMDDTVDLIEEMPSNVVKRILKSVNKSDRKVINELLNYPDDSAGSIMTTEFVDLKEKMSVEEAIAKIKKIGDEKESIYTCYVLDDTRELVGVVSLRDIILSKPGTSLKDIIVQNPVTAHTLEDQEDVAKKFEKYDVTAIPVVDKENRLVGIITIDDAIDVLQEEVKEDFSKMAALTPAEDSYFKTSVFSHAKNRILWLLLLMLSSMITGTIITNYENAFASVPILVAFIPMLMDTGGNCGSQTSTLIIRGLAKDEIQIKDFFKAWWKEIRVAIIVGLGLIVANTIRIMIQYNNIQLALVVGVTLMGVVIISKSLGCILPIAAKKIKLDPAIMAAPIISTIVDTCAVLIYFNVALLLMNI
ncbi:MAG: magnesium transporter [Clostridia bacterium]|nr:magnesium transporter [Clostridia bacterium]